MNHCSKAMAHHSVASNNEIENVFRVDYKHKRPLKSILENQMEANNALACTHHPQ